MKLRLDETIAVAIVVVGLVAVALVTGRPTGTYTDTFSTHDSDAGGYLAWFRLLGREGIRVERFERRAGALDASIGTLIVANNGDFSQSEVAPLERFVHDGGSLVWVSGGVDETDPAWKPLHFPRFAQRAAPAARNRAAPLRRTDVLRDVRGVEGDGRTRIRLQGRPDAVVLLAGRAGPVAARYRLGAGEVTVVADPTLFANRNLAAADNARFAVALVSKHRRLVAFEEAIHGYARERSIWDVFPGPLRAATLAAVAVALLALIGAGLRVLPLVAAPPGRDPDPAAYLSAVAGLLRRGRATARAAEDLRRATFRGCAQSLGIGERAGERELVNAYRERGDTAAAEMIREIGRRCARHVVTEADMIVVAERCFRLRKDGRDGSTGRYRSASR